MTTCVGGLGKQTIRCICEQTETPVSSNGHRNGSYEIPLTHQQTPCLDAVVFVLMCRPLAVLFSGARRSRCEQALSRGIAGQVSISLNHLLKCCSVLAVSRRSNSDRASLVCAILIALILTIAAVVAAVAVRGTTAAVPVVRRIAVVVIISLKLSLSICHI